MSFPTSPTNGQVATVNSIDYIYNTTDTTWKRVPKTVSASGGGGTGIKYTAANIVPTGNTVGDQWYNINENILYEYINDGTSNTWIDVSSSPVSAGAGLSSGGTGGATNARSTINSMIFGG